MKNCVSLHQSLCLHETQENFIFPVFLVHFGFFHNFLLLLMNDYKKIGENHKIWRIYKSPHNLLQHTESMSLTFFQIPHNLEFFYNFRSTKGTWLENLWIKFWCGKLWKMTCRLYHAECELSHTHMILFPCNEVCQDESLFK